MKLKASKYCKLEEKQDRNECTFDNVCWGYDYPTHLLTAAKATPPSDPGDKAKGNGNKPEALVEGGDIASIRQPAHGAVQFIMGKQEILVDPAELYDAFMYYRDMVAHHNIHEPFTKVLKTSIKYIWELLCQQQAQEQPTSIRMVVPQ